VVALAVDLATGQDEQLREALAHARSSHFYADRIPAAGGTATDWLAGVPLTRRSDLMKALPFARLAGPREELWQYVESSGTTGSGTLAAGYTREDMARSVTGMTPTFLELFDRGRTVLNRFPYPLAAVSSTLEWLAREGGACIVPAGNLSWLVPFDRALDLLRRVKPDVMAALPLEPIILAVLAEHLGISRRELWGSLDTIIAGGSPLPAVLTEIIERDFGVRVVEIYGSTETLTLGASCHERRLHLSSGNFVIEVMDPERWTPVRCGKPGALVLTSLHLRAMPLVRYVNEDIVQLDTTPCPCGSGQPSIRVLGRLGETIRLSGRTLYPTEVLDAAFRFAVAHESRVLLTIVYAQGVHLRVEVAEPKAAPGEAALADLRSALGVRVDVEFVRRGDLLDCESLIKVPRVYKPAPIVDWRGSERRPYTLMETLISLPSMGLADLRRIASRALRNRLSKRRLR
jgi:phenylacetate-CoA ligase